MRRASIARSSALALGTALCLSLALPAGAQDRGLSGPYLAARTAIAANDYDAAARFYARALIRDGRNPELLQNAVVAQMGLGKLARAVPIARTLRETGTESQIGNLVMLTDQLDRADWDAVLADFDAGLTVGPLVDGLIQAWAELGAGDAQAAEAVFDRVTEETGLGAFGLYHKALARAVTGDYEGAHDIIAGTDGVPLRLTRRGIVAHAQILSQLDRNDDALALIAEYFGTNLTPSLEELSGVLRAGQTAPFDLIGDARDGAAEVFFTVAGALRGEASESYTLLYARATQAIRPDHTDAILLSAGLLDTLAQYELAMEAYNQVPRDDPAYHIAALGRAEAMRQADKDEAAIEALEQLAETHGNQPLVHTTLGDTLRQMERFNEATEAYNRSVALFDSDSGEQWIVYFARGITHEREDRWPQAEADFRKALELNPGQPSVLNYLGYSFLEMQTNLDEAMAMIRQAVEARPDSGHIVDSLGWGLYRLGQYDEAVGHMERAAELLPVDPIINDHLGDVYWAVGRKTEARFQWHRALSFEPEEDEAERIRRKLEVGLDQVLEEEGAEPLEVAGDEG
ncbi:MAG: tetratricopeptide repeat protein [Pseudomonadota bacterium]